MSLITWLILIILVFNTFGAIFTVLREVRDISTTWAWLLVLIFFTDRRVWFLFICWPRLINEKIATDSTRI